MEGSFEKPTEIEAGLCFADLSPGDRIYNLTQRATYFGTVLESTSDEVFIKLDDGVTLAIIDSGTMSISDRLRAFGKPLDLTAVQAGSLISRKYPGEKRVYAQVMEHIPGALISFWYVEDSSALTTISADGMNPGYLEERMMYWELED